MQLQAFVMAPRRGMGGGIVLSCTLGRFTRVWVPKPSEEEQNLFTLPRVWLSVLHRTACSLVTIPTELPRLEERMQISTKHNTLNVGVTLWTVRSPSLQFIFKCALKQFAAHFDESSWLSKSLLLDPTPTILNPELTFRSCTVKTCFKYILSRKRISYWFIPLEFSSQMFACIYVPPIACNAYVNFSLSV